MDQETVTMNLNLKSHKVFRYTFILGWLLILSTSLISCGEARSSNSNKVAQKVDTTATYLPEATPTFTATATDIPSTPTVKLIASITPTVIHQATYKITQIVLNSSEREYVKSAYWSNDGHRIEFLVQNITQGDHHLYEYDMTSSSTNEIHSQMDYDPAIWRNIGVIDPTKEGFDPLLGGYVSPSGDYLIYPVYIRGSTDTSEVKTQIWISTRDGQNRHKLSQEDMLASISRAVWINNEQQVVFDVTTHGGYIYVADVKTGALQNFSELTENKALSLGSGWSISPTGTRIVIPSSSTADKEKTSVFSLMDGKEVNVIDEWAEFPSWTPDGEKVCYWTNLDPMVLNLFDPQPVRMSLHCYDINSHQIFTVLDEADVAGSITYPSTYRLMVSSDLQKLILLNSEIWLIEK